MSSVRSLRIKLAGTDVGSLFGLDDGRVYFRFDESYANNPDRPILSLAFMAGEEVLTRAQLLDPSLASLIGAGQGKLPVFFRNLLPEGVLRKHLISLSGLLIDDELGLLAFCGEDLPGDVVAVAEQLSDSQLGRLITQDRDSYELSSYQLPTPRAVSLPGVQPKVSLMLESNGRYVMRSKDDIGRHFIAKLPASEYPNMPEIEKLAMDLAEAAGVTVCHTELHPLSAIADNLPYALRTDARNFLLVSRFDRDVKTPTKRLHMEDFAQVMERNPDEKYQGNYDDIGYLLTQFSSAGQDDILELLRRIKVNELLGNTDAHLKNFSLLYDSSAKNPRLSPAYDIVAYAAYIENYGHGLKFTEQQTTSQILSPAVVRKLANSWHIPETRLADTVATAVDNAMRRWPVMIAAATIDANQKRRLINHINENPSAKAWRRRNASV